MLGNHDTIRMVPGLEDMGIQMLLNENHAIERGYQRIYLAGIDDAHYYRADNIEKAATGIRPRIFRSCYRTRPRSISRRPMPTSACSSAGTPMVGKFVFRADSNHFGFGLATQHGLGLMEVRRYDWLYISRCWLLYCSGAVQLPPGNHAPSPAVSQVARVNRIARPA